jgi:tetratricopeptide (TPR) repeat protein
MWSFLGLHLLRIIAPFLSDHIDLWGVHFYRYLSLPVSIICLALSALLLYPPVINKLASRVHAAGKSLANSNVARFIFWTIILGGAAYCFWSIRVIPYVHDGVTLLADIGKQYLNSWADYIAYRPQEWLSTFLYDRLGRLMSKNNRSLVEAYYMVSSVLGTCAIYIYWLIAGELFAKRTARFFAALSLGGGVIFLIYCGFIEYTTPELFTGTICCWLGLRYLRTRQGWWWPLAVFPIVFSFHMESVILAPGLLFIVVHRFPGISRILLQIFRLEYPRALFGGLIILALWLVYAPPTAFLDRFTVGGNDAWGGIQLFSVRHWMDIGNYIYLGAPLALFMTIIRWKSLRALVQTDDRAVFLCMLSVAAAFMMLITPLLGINWDSASLTFLVWTTWGLIIVTNVPASTFQQRQTLTLIATQTLILTLPVLLVYTNESNATRQHYYVSALAVNRSPVEETLEPEMLRFKYFYYVEKDTTQYLQIADKFIAAEDSVLAKIPLWEMSRLLELAGHNTYELQLRERDIARCKTQIAREPDNWHHYWEYASYCLAPLKRYEEMEITLKKALELNPTQPDLVTNYGQSLFLQHKFQQALPWLQQAIADTNGIDGFRAFENSTINDIYLTTLLNLKKWDDLQNYLQKHAANPESIHHFFQGQVSMHNKDLEMAEKEFMLYKKSQPTVRNNRDLTFLAATSINLAMLYNLKSEFDLALDQLSIMKNLLNAPTRFGEISNSSMAGIYYQASLAAWGKNMLPEAREYIRIAVEFSPNDQHFLSIKREIDASR